MSTHEKRRKRIAVVDDEKDFVALIEAWLKPLYDVVPYTDAAAASEGIGDVNPDLVVLDIRMPSGSGFDVCRWLRSAPEFAHMPILFLTGSRSDADFKRHVRAGGTGYLQKPVDRKTLLGTIADLLAKKDARPAEPEDITPKSVR